MAVQWRGKLDSVRQAVVNGRLRGDVYRQRMRRLGLPAPRFNLAGYVIRTLNQARAECHGVQMSRLTRAAQVRAQAGARKADAGGVPDSAFEQRKKEKIRRLLSTPAKVPTPPKSAIPAQKPRLCDKSAEHEFLQAVQSAARSRSWQYRKYANPAQKLGFSEGTCGRAGFTLKCSGLGLPGPPLLF